MADLPSQPFMKLPLELRQLVYHYVLVDNGSDKVIKIALNDTHFRSESLENAAGAIRVSKSISNELLDYIFGMFAFSLSDLAPSSYSILQIFCDLIGKKNLKLVKEIIIPHFLSHDVDAFQWENWEAVSRKTLRWGVEVFIYNRIFELQNRKLLDRLPSLKYVKVGLDWPYVSQSLVREYFGEEPLGMFASSFSIPRPEFPVAVYPGLWWLLAELYARDISFGIYWTDIRNEVHFRRHGVTTKIPEEEFKIHKRFIMQMLGVLLASFGSRRSSSDIYELGTLPDDLFEYGIGEDYLETGPRPHLYNPDMHFGLSSSLR
ncbi:hypothetical protein SLS60_005635 [Paraconiothyrium brasiliense]|uniref:Uncharacterized protein n=1 Tax=Paraconiothyrium brasiliense TaxID=300254 RepID=A0ABR3RHY4_9PLEO